MPVDTPPTVDAVVVRAIRLPAAAGDPAYSIIRLDHADLRASPRLDESLSAVPGFSLFRRNSSLVANPTTQGVSLRAIAGSGASRALVTLDGVPQNDPFGGWVIWSALPSQAIDSAKLVRGAGAGPYGAGALTGTIDLAQEQSVPGGIAADASYGDHNDLRGAAIASARFGSASVLISAAGESSDGFVPVRQGRGPADQPLTLHDWSGSGLFTDDIGPGVLAARVSAYEERRGAGILYAGSRARGQQVSLTYTRAPTADAFGYRLQAWFAHTDLLNTSTSVTSALGPRDTATPAGNQYATPAIGYGFNGALRRAGAHYSWEIGSDLRISQGQSEELYTFTAGHYTRSRIAGGTNIVGGLYAEGEHDFGPWLVTAGVRVDGWAAVASHRTEHALATGALLLSQHAPDQSGFEPTGRIGLRRNFDGGYYARAAAYAGFRPATLNELDRPFRVGNDLTEANPALKPERLYGAEIGTGQDGDHGAWSVTAFANRLQDAIINATVAHGPITDPFDPAGGGFIAAGGTLYQRRNVDHIDAFGIEAEAHRRLIEGLEVRVAADYTDAEVDGGAAAPQLTGRRPAQTPKFAATAGVDWRPIERLTLTLDARYEGARYDDDQNTRRLAPGVTADARVEVRVVNGLVIYVAADNLFDAALQTGRTAANLVSYDAPRMVRVGLAWRH
jgi:vitamin B12 transporter